MLAAQTLRTRHMLDSTAAAPAQAVPSGLGYTAVLAALCDRAQFLVTSLSLCVCLCVYVCVCVRACAMVRACTLLTGERRAGRHLTVVRALPLLLQKSRTCSVRQGFNREAGCAVPHLARFGTAQPKH